MVGCLQQHDRIAITGRINEGDTMRWTKPAFEDLRLGFEVTMYIFNR